LLKYALVLWYATNTPCNKIKFTMHTKESIYEHLQNIMVELFEIEADLVRPDAKLYEDLDIDSIDAVDMIIKLKELTGKKMQPAEFKNVRTMQDVVDVVYTLLNSDDAPSDSDQHVADG